MLSLVGCGGGLIALPLHSVRPKTLKMKEMDGMKMFEEAARYAVERLDVRQLDLTLEMMEEWRVPVYMMGNGVESRMQELMDEWGEEHGLEERWWEAYGDMEDAIAVGVRWAKSRTGLLFISARCAWKLFKIRFKN